LLEHLRLRAGFDFLLLRCASGELDAELGEWWSDFMAGDAAEREALLARKPSASASAAAGGSGTTAAAPAKKRKRRGGRNRSGKSATGEGQAGDA
jgi:poly(A) polymerase